MKPLAGTCLLLVLSLTGCQHLRPFAKAERPDTIRVYFAGSENVITNQDTISAIICPFTNAQRKWERFWAPIPAAGLVVDLQKGDREIVRASIGSDWIVVKTDEMYSTSITKREHDDLIRLLGVNKEQ